MPDIMIYNPKGKRAGSIHSAFIYPALAAAVYLGNGATLRYRRRKIWTTGSRDDFWSESADGCAELVLDRIIEIDDLTFNS